MLLSRSVVALALATLSQAQRPFPITGVTVNGGPVPLRININDLQANGGPAWDLYIQALIAMYAVPDGDPLSFFQIAGIHGAPFVSWNNSGPLVGDGWRGYCPHGEEIFLSWHRPYVLLFEQVLVSTAIKIANTYPSQYRQQYTSAAQELRAPYWDWAASSQVPACTIPSTMQIWVPNGNSIRQVQVANPLQTYHYPQNALNGAYGTFNPGASQTVRCNGQGQSYPATANSNLQSRPYKSWMYDTFTTSTSFIDFASTSGDGVSLESVHNGIHWDAGCAGQFLAPETSAYDPLFFMHHSNVDRLWAYWEATRSTMTIFTNTYGGQSRWGVRSGTQINNRSPLGPFFDGNGSPHTSLSVTPISLFGYSYEGMEYWEKSPDQMSSDVSAIINNLYGPQSRSKRGLLDEVLGSTKQRFFMHISVNVEDLPQRPCEINAFVDGKKAGNMIVMKLPATGLVKAAFAIDGTLEGLANGIVSWGTSLLTGFEDSVTFQIKKIDGTEISPDQVPSLEYHLSTFNMTLPKTISQLPILGSRKHHPTHKASGRRMKNKSSAKWRRN